MTEINFKNTSIEVTEKQSKQLEFDNEYPEAMFVIVNLKNGSDEQDTSLLVEFEDPDVEPSENNSQMRVVEIANFKAGEKEGKKNIEFKATKDDKIKLIANGPGTLIVEGSYGPAGFFTLEDDEEEEEEEAAEEE